MARKEYRLFPNIALADKKLSGIVTYSILLTIQSVRIGVIIK